MTKTENEEIIHLKVKSNDHEEIFFKIKKVTPLKKLMEKYCERMGLSNLNNVRFLFDGERIVPSNTPAQLNMQNGDEIDVYVEQHGGLQPRLLLSIDHAHSHPRIGRSLCSGGEGPPAFGSLSRPLVTKISTFSKMK